MEIKGIYHRTVFRNEASGFTRFTFVTDACRESRNEKGLLMCAGVTPVFASGMPLKLEGEISANNLFSEFHFTSIEPCSDKAQVTMDYLSGGAFQGIGKKTAEKIISVTGPDIFSFIQRSNAKELLAERIGEEKIDSLFQTLRNTFQTKAVMDYIEPFGGDYTHAAQITQKFPVNSVETLRNNCYRVGMDSGMPFYVCDSIARFEGYFAYDERRISALLQTAFNTLTGQGHTCANIDTLYWEIQKIIRSSAYTDIIPKGVVVRAANKDKSFTIDLSSSPTYYLSDLYRAERDLAREALRIQNNARPLPYSEAAISTIEAEEKIAYSEKQKTAFSFLKTTGIKILTGGPGVGKTTTINGLIKAYKLMNPSGKILLCAPTGRAAQRMYESTGIRAQTIHKAIDIRPFGNDIQYKTLDDPLEYNFIIVDEMSMADITIISMLLGAIKTDSTVILCGDVNQLPSVGPGAVLHDLIDSLRFETVMLDVIYRQANGSSIISNAAKINSGKNNLVLDPRFEVITTDNEQEIQKKIIELIKTRHNSSDIFDLQVLSSTRKGAAGTLELNTALQEWYNVQKALSSDEPVIQYGHYQYSVGDKIMMVANNYKERYFNGDLGVVKAINSDSITVDIDNTALEISKKNLADMSLAYATTIHKSQGSEFPTIIIALPANPSIMLQRNLLYTAITRAKRNVVIVEERGAIAKAIKTISNKKRESHLLEKLQSVVL